MKSKYDPGYCQQLIDHMSEGLGFKSFAGKIGVNRSTLYDWVNQHEEFSDAKEVALSCCQLYWERLGIDLCRGDARGNPTTFVWMTKNILGWSDAGDTNGENQTPIHIEIVRAGSEKEAG